LGSSAFQKLPGSDFDPRCHFGVVGVSEITGVRFRSEVSFWGRRCFKICPEPTSGRGAFWPEAMYIRSRAWAYGRVPCPCSCRVLWLCLQPGSHPLRGQPLALGALSVPIPPGAFQGKSGVPPGLSRVHPGDHVHSTPQHYKRELLGAGAVGNCSPAGCCGLCCSRSGSSTSMSNISSSKVLVAELLLVLAAAAAVSCCSGLCCCGC
jgi:hypothetical protein